MVLKGHEKKQSILGFQGHFLAWIVEGMYVYVPLRILYVCGAVPLVEVV